jgi:ATP-binding cassette subfamily D (ALD) protein 4
MQMRVNAESAAFYCAGGIEEKKTNRKLEQLIATQRRLVHWQFALNCKNSTWFSLPSALRIEPCVVESDK